MTAVPINCFLIEDDKEDQKKFCMALAGIKEHIHCVVAADNEEVFEFLENEMFIPDYIFIDMDAPKINGFECLKKIRTIQRLDQVPVYLNSIYTDPDLISKSQELGAAGFIMKRAKVSELSDTLRFIFNM
jgi:PleD family two-component response regulator